MKQRIVGLVSAACLICSLISIPTYASNRPEIYRDSVSVRVGNTTEVDFTYGSSASKAEIVISSLDIDAEMRNNSLYVTGRNEGKAYITMSFNDGTVDILEVNVVGKYDSVDEKNSIEVKRGGSKSIYIDLDVYNASKATITYDEESISVNKSRFYDSDTLKISGKNFGSSVLRVKYSTGETETYHIDVVDDYTSNEEVEKIIVKKNENIDYYVDLEKHNADSANIYYNSNLYEVNRTYFRNSGNLVITPIKEGANTITIKYDSGEIQYLNIVCNTVYNRDSYVSVDEVELEKNESLYFYVYLGEDADTATLSLSNSNAYLSTEKVTSDSRIKITGRYEGEATLKVSFNDGTRQYISVNVTNPNYVEPDASLDKDILVLNETGNLNIFMGSKNTQATITFDKPEYFDTNLKNYSNHRSSYTIYSSNNKTENVKITATKVIDETYITVKFPEGKSFKILVKNIDVDTADGRDKQGNNFVLRDKIFVNDEVLRTGYIAGYSNGNFGPNNTISRQEFATMLANILDYKGTIDETDYIYDVKADWSKHRVAELVAMGAIDRDKAFRPTDYITRYEVAEMLYRILDLERYSASCPLRDVDPTSSQGWEIARCWNAGIIAGYPDGTFGGSDNITRAQAVVMLDRVFYSDLNTDYKVNRFPDVQESHWAYQYILKASRN